MKILYVAGKYTADTNEQIEANVNKASKIAEKYIHKGYAVFCPHTNYGFMEVEYEQVMKMCFRFIELSDVVVMVDNWRDSKGAVRELEYAINLGKQIIYE